MVLAVVATLLVLVAVGVLAGWAVSSGPLGTVVVVFSALLMLIGVAASVQLARHDRNTPPRHSPGARRPVSGDIETVRGIVERLAVMTDTAMPRVEVLGDRAPASWTTAWPGHAPTIHVTTGLLDRLPSRELQAVLAHEMSHIVHRDAYLMTALAGPPHAFFEGLTSFGAMNWLTCRITDTFTIHLSALGAVLLAFSRVVSRHRELAADRGAAILVGSPAAVASALIMVDDCLRGAPTADLRAVAAHDDFNFVAARERGVLMLPWATHPSTRLRVARLERLGGGEG